MPKDEIVAQGYDLSLNRYKEVVHDEVEHRPPLKIIADLEKLETEIQQGLAELRADTTYFVDATATEADLKWLSYRLSGLGLTSLNRAAAVPGLNREDAYRQRLLLPPLREQRRVAAILDQADALRAKRRQTLASSTD